VIKAIVSNPPDRSKHIGDETATTGASLVSTAAPTVEPVLRVYQGHLGAWQGSVVHVGGKNLVPGQTSEVLVNLTDIGPVKLENTVRFNIIG
jgi:hypothetical protein